VVSHVTRQLEQGCYLEDVKICLRLTTVKTLNARWLINNQIFEAKQTQRSAVQGFEIAGIHNCFDNTTPSVPFKLSTNDDIPLATVEAFLSQQDVEDYESSDDELTICQLFNKRS
jgi:hypothetical protein